MLQKKLRPLICDGNPGEGQFVLWSHSHELIAARYKKFSRWVLWFLLFNVLCAQGVALFYFYRTGLYPKTLPSAIYSFLYWNGHFATFGIAVLLALSVVFLALPFYALHRLTLSLLMSVGLGLLFVDTYVFAQYKFHINLFVLDLFLRGQGQVIQFSWQTWIFIACLAAGLFTIEFLTAKFIWQNLSWIGQKLSAGKICLFYLVCILSMHAIHIVADGMYYQPITHIDNLFPLSYPTYAQDILKKYNLVNVEEYKKRSVFRKFSDDSERTLRYPLVAMNCVAPEKPMNILWIAVDALRADMLQADIMPNAFALSGQSQVFTNHMSNGNSTRYGVFSMFYGISSSYFESARASRTSPILMDQLQKENYQFGIFGSAPLTKPEFDQTVFSKIPNLRLSSTSYTSDEKDGEITGEWGRFIDQRDGSKPFFGFLFYDSTHAYEFPESMPPKFKPSWGHVDYMALDNNFDPTPFLNRYKNSAYYVDTLIGRVLAQLKSKGLDKNTIVLISSDHGQEFNDNKLNYWGHNSNFSPAQTHVPLVIYWPGMAPSVRTATTSHFDLSPTFLQSALGCKADSASFSSGQNLFENKSKPWVLMNSYDTYAVYTPHDIVSVNPTGNYEVLDQHYQPVSDAKLDKLVLMEALREMGRFYK